MKLASVITASLALTVSAGLAAAGPDGITPEQKEILSQLPEFEQPELWFGADAPEMKIAEWVKGDPISEFEDGRVYVVEFWATWCGPCIRAFPHLSEVQAEMADDVTIVGVNIWERVEGDERTELVRNFVAEQGDNMSYTVALEDGDAMAKNWMKAAGRNGIPSAFIVDQNGTVAWMGHPMGMDEPLKQIVGGEYDWKPAAKEAAKDQITQQHYRHVMTEIAEGDADKGYAMAVALAETKWADDARMLNAVAWSTLTSDKLPRNTKASLKIAKAAGKATNYEDPMILDTVARAYYENGNMTKAVELQTKAVELAPDRAKAELTEALEKYKAAADKS